VRAALLRGRQETTLGRLGEADLGELAAAISRGGAAKPYPHVDPNEDAVLVAVGSRGALIAVADGHWGHRASECALDRIFSAHAEPWTAGPPRGADGWYQAALAALVEANDAVLALHDENERSRTTLALALARPGEDLLVSACVGDSLLYRVDGRSALELVRPRRPRFLGQGRVAASGFERGRCIAVETLAAPLALVAVTDGLSEDGIGVDDPAGAVSTCVQEAAGKPREERARSAARAVVEAALAAHISHDAGDNVAAAVAWLGR
jgi:hypothetical protein